MTAKEQEVIQAAKTIANYCRSHICNDCPLNLASKAESITKAHCVCDYNILHLPSTWKIEDLRSE